MGIPFQRELRRGCGSVLADGDGEAWRTDRARERTLEGAPQSGGRGRHDEPDGRRRRLRAGGLTQQEHGPAGVPGATVQPPRRREVQPRRIAADFEKHRREPFQPRGFLGNPQRVHELRRLRDHQPGRVDPIEGLHPRRVGKAGLAEDFRGPDPQQRHRLGVKDGTHERQDEAGRSRSVAHCRAVDFRKRCARQTAAKNCVEAFGAGGEKTVFGRDEPVTAKLYRLASNRILFAAAEMFGKPTLDLRDFVAQGKNGFLRRGGCRHDGLLSASFLLCSNRFQSPPEESSAQIGEFIPCRISAAGAIVRQLGEGLETRGTKGYMRRKGKSMARIYQTRTWHDQLSPSMEEMEFLALEAYAHLPEQFRALTGEIIIQIAEFPTDEIMDDLSLETPFDLLGLFEGRGIAERWNPQTGEGPNRVTLYRRAILDYWAENDETLGSIVTHVLIHEIGHHFGLSDDDMEKIEENADQ
jgi:predicted Zn-dependent protease with MMP-like domain